MKILHSIETWLNPTENWIFDQINATDFEQDVICTKLRNPQTPLPNGKAYIRKMQHPVENIKRKLSNRFNINFTRKDKFNRYADYDILFSHFGYQAWEDLLYLKNSSTKRIVRFYGIDLDFTFRKKFWQERYNTVFERYDKMVVEGLAMQEKLQQFGCAPEKIKILHHGIVPFSKPPERDFSDVKNVIKCLICGRFAEKKGFRYAVQALGELRHQFKAPVELTIIGDAARDNDFLEKEEMEKLNRRYKLKAKFLGMVSLEEMQKQMAINDFFISPSVTPANGDVEGGFPTTLIHAANHGMILVGTTHCDIPEIIHHRKNGFLSPERDVRSLVENLLDLSCSSPKELRAMSDYSYQLVNSQFNLAEEGKQLESLYHETLNGNGKK